VYTHPYNIYPLVGDKLYSSILHALMPVQGRARGLKEADLARIPRSKPHTPPVMTMSITCFPLELLECFMRAIDARQDLLSLALTCSHLHDIIIPNHLDYRSLRVSTHHTDIWDHLLAQPNLAANVRTLTLYVGHPDAFAPIFRDEVRVTFRAPRGFAQAASWMHPSTDTLASVFRILRAAHALELHVSWIPDEDETQDVDAFRSASGVLDAACVCMPALDELTICAPGIHEQEVEREGDTMVSITAKRGSRVVLTAMMAGVAHARPEENRLPCVWALCVYVPGAGALLRYADHVDEARGAFRASS
jgi:hypothetical protein